MKYKIYRLFAPDMYCAIREVIEAAEFEDEEFDTMEDALYAIRGRGNDLANYTILPYIYLT